MQPEETHQTRRQRGCYHVRAGRHFQNCSESCASYSQASADRVGTDKSKSAIPSSRSEAAVAQPRPNRAVFVQIGAKECSCFPAITWKERHKFLARTENSVVRGQQRLDRRHEGLPKNYPEIQGKLVDSITDAVKEGTLYFNVRFTDKTGGTLQRNVSLLLSALNSVTGKRETLTVIRRCGGLLTIKSSSIGPTAMLQPRSGSPRRRTLEEREHTRPLLLDLINSELSAMRFMKRHSQIKPV
jgi:hypothetical protein